MKALTLTQPWATLVAIGAKRIETRSWRTDYRGPLAIPFAAWMADFDVFPLSCRSGQPWNRMKEVLDEHGITETPRGAIVATCWLLGCVPTGGLAPLPEAGTDEGLFGDYGPGRFAWLLGNIIPVPRPIPARGKLGLWDWDPQPGELPHCQCGRPASVFREIEGEVFGECSERATHIGHDSLRLVGD